MSPRPPPPGQRLLIRPVQLFILEQQHVIHPALHRPGAVVFLRVGTHREPQRRRLCDDLERLIQLLAAVQLDLLRGARGAELHEDEVVPLRPLGLVADEEHVVVAHGGRAQVRRDQAREPLPRAPAGRLAADDTAPAAYGVPEGLGLLSVEAPGGLLGVVVLLAVLHRGPGGEVDVQAVGGCLWGVAGLGQGPEEVCGVEQVRGGDLGACDVDGEAEQGRQGLVRGRPEDHQGDVVGVVAEGHLVDLYAPTHLWRPGAIDYQCWGRVREHMCEGSSHLG